jgi:capsular exopolysaccharide synthesis family protein
MRLQKSVITEFDHSTEALHGLGLTQMPAPIRDVGAERARLSEKLVSLVAPDSCAADQYRALRHTVERLRRDDGFLVIGVTSPCPGDGKSITALNLAGALAQSPDARVLVIDADLRRPSVADYLGITPRSPGLAEAILDPASELPRVVRSLDSFNLSVLTAGSPRVGPYELLNSPRLDALLRDARRHYDCVLIDTPPAVPLPDCRLIERLVDGFLLVVAAHKTPRKLVAEALNLLDPAKVVGIVFNADDRSRSADYAYYGYGHRDRLSWWSRLTGSSR